MKKYCLTWLALILLIVAACNTHDPKYAKIEVLPSFNMVSLDGSIRLNSDNLPTSHPYIFILFDPECGHCQKMTKALIAHQAEWKQVYIYMITLQPAEEAIAFVRHYHLDSIKNLFVGIDDHYSFFNAFSPKVIPYIAVYNASKQLKMVSTGEVTIEDLIQNLN